MLLCAFYHLSLTFSIKFARYYKLPLEEAPIIELGAQSNFHVTKIFLDDIEPMVTNRKIILLKNSIFSIRYVNKNVLDDFQEFEENIKMPEITEQMYRCALRLIVFFERIDRMHSKENGIDEETYERQTKPTVLIFLPGIFEIKQMYQRLEEWVLLYVQIIFSLKKKMRIFIHLDLSMHSVWYLFAFFCLSVRNLVFLHEQTTLHLFLNRSCKSVRKISSPLDDKIEISNFFRLIIYIVFYHRIHCIFIDIMIKFDS